MAMYIRLATGADAPAIEAIYAHYVLTSTCTWQETPGTLDERRAWLAQHDAAHPVTVAVDDGAVVGWGSLSRYNPRSGYRFTVEDSVYVRADRQRRGIGKALLADLIARARETGFRAIIAGVAADQAPSVALHAAHGFEIVARLREVGRKFDRWLDLVYMQLLLEERQSTGCRANRPWLAMAKVRQGVARSASITAARPARPGRRRAAPTGPP